MIVIGIVIIALVLAIFVTLVLSYRAAIKRDKGVKHER
jgi:hypothetical protein